MRVSAVLPPFLQKVQTPFRIGLSRIEEAHIYMVSCEKITSLIHDINELFFTLSVRLPTPTRDKRHAVSYLMD